MPYSIVHVLCTVLFIVVKTCRIVKLETISSPLYQSISLDQSSKQFSFPVSSSFEVEISFLLFLLESILWGSIGLSFAQWGVLSDCAGFTLTVNGNCHWLRGLFLRVCTQHY